MNSLNSEEVNKAKYLAKCLICENIITFASDQFISKMAMDHDGEALETSGIKVKCFLKKLIEETEVCDGAVPLHCHSTGIKGKYVCLPKYDGLL